MHRPLIVLSTVAALCASTPAWAQQDPHARQEIAHLLDFVAQSGCQFNRNGSWHDSKAARDHLQDKYEYLQRRSLVPTTQAFIERAASESSFSHKAYQVRCGNAQPITSAQWLNGELARYRAAQK
ncbi:hypothetical protein SRABI118_00902 [Massilia sp. Bi118]|uniref:DUF5329 domain-containing protein n=1 Tax=Massilia sp. Bi118 TaxID=2822346 RepID=UPI001D94FC87|nr:DUF5329 domain-containing protein [Massilia sp. Bi118]CAH0166917.1 hypothetical protein SRABI118_00902 [Massilia sp. Bi118]